MAMVGVVSGSLYRRTHSLVLGRRPLGAVLHSSNEPGELLQWLCHYDSTINIVLDIIIILLYQNGVNEDGNLPHMAEHCRKVSISPTVTGRFSRHSAK